MDAIDQHYATIYDLLSAAHKPKNLLGASGYCCYRFPEESGLGNFVLRLPGSMELEGLSSTTMLTPVDLITQGINIGQPLLKANESDLTIQLRQPGHNLLWVGSKPLDPNGPYNSTEMLLTFSGNRLCKRLLELARASGVNPFVHLIDQAANLFRTGYSLDLNLSNIMLDESRQQLALVDQRVRPGGDTGLADVDILAHIKKTLVEALNVDIKLNAAISSLMEPSDPAALDSVIAMVEDAHYQLYQRSTNGNPIAPYPSATTNGAHSDQPAFSRVLSTSAIALTDPPHVLVERLRELHQFVNAPQK